MNILFVARLEMAYPPSDGGEVRMFNLIRCLCPQHQVTLLALSDPSAEQMAGTTYLRSLGCRVHVVPFPTRPVWQRRALLVRQFWRGEVLHIVDSYYPQVARQLSALTASEPFDVVDIQLMNLAPYLHDIAPDYRGCTVLSMHDIDYVRFRRILSVERSWPGKLRTLYLDLLFSRRTMLRYARRFDQCVVVSPADREILRRDAPDLDVAVVPNGVDVAAYPMLDDPPLAPTLCFAGKMSYRPNVDAVLYFCREVLPLIRQQIPDVKLWIVGRNPTAAVQALASEHIVVTGYVESMIPYYQQSAVCVVPLRAGGGTRLKVLEAMALGRPVVSTPVGCEGLEVVHGQHMLIADTPEEFAAQTVRLLQDRALQKHLARHARQLIETVYDWSVIARKLVHVYNRIVSHHHSRIASR